MATSPVIQRPALRSEPTPASPDPLHLPTRTFPWLYVVLARLAVAAAGAVFLMFR
jgi:hypothetical protein